MICKDCGCEIPNDSVFCQECGVKLELTGVQKEMPRYLKPNVACVKPLSPEEEAKIKKRNKIIGISVGSVACLLLGIGVLSCIIKPAINLNDYVTVSAEGYNTVGKVAVSFDADKFKRDYEKKLGAKSKIKSRLYNNSTEDASLRFLTDSDDDVTVSAALLSKCVSGKVDNTSTLSNGDVVTYKWKCNDDYVLDTYGFKLKHKDIEYKVDGLKEAQTFDPFDGVEVKFSGISPNGTAEITGRSSDEAAVNFSYNIDKRNGLSTGDLITVKVNMDYGDDPVSYCIEKYGKIPSELSKSYTVEGLNSYIRKIEDVSDNCLLEMQSQADDVFNAKVVASWDSETESLKDKAYVGSYLLTSKSSETYGNDNIYYLIYKVTVNNKFSKDEDKYEKDNEYYWFIAYKNLLVNDNKENAVNITDYSIPENRITIDSGISRGLGSTKEWRYNGYATLDDLYKAVITSNADTYYHEEKTN